MRLSALFLADSSLTEYASISMPGRHVRHALLGDCEQIYLPGWGNACRSNRPHFLKKGKEEGRRTAAHIHVIDAKLHLDRSKSNCAPRGHLTRAYHDG